MHIFMTSKLINRNFRGGLTVPQFCLKKEIVPYSKQLKFQMHLIK